MLLLQSMLEEKRESLTKLLIQLLDERSMREIELKKRLVSNYYVSENRNTHMLWR